MPRRIITLTSDFGLSDQHVGVMKGVILGILPGATIVDITHDVRPYEVLEGAFVVAEAYRWFPRKTVHVVVVDPGVGSSRRPILVEAGGQLFTGPDNGIFSMVRKREPNHKVREITNRAWMVPAVSQTFHGRDVFAPVAAHLAKGGTAARAGKLIADALMLASVEGPQRTGKRTWTGQVLKADRFGNLITNFESAAFASVRTRPFECAIGLEKVSQLATSYSEMPQGEPCLIEGSAGYLEVSLREASAAQQLGVAAGSPVELTVF